MSRDRWTVIALVFALSSYAGSVQAQEIRVEDCKYMGQWVVGGIYDTNRPRLGGLGLTYGSVPGPFFCKTKGEALQRASEIVQFWSSGVNADALARVNVVLVQGEDAVAPIPGIRNPLARNNQGVTQEVREDAENTAADILQDDVKNALRNKYQQLTDVASRVMKAKGFMVANVDKVSAENIKQANALINSFNERLEDVQSQPGAGVFTGIAGIPKMNPVTPESLDRVRTWNQAKSEQTRLTESKQSLDAERASLQRERARLAEEGRRLERAEPSNGGSPERASELGQEMAEYREGVRRYRGVLESYDQRLKDYQQSAAGKLEGEERPRISYGQSTSNPDASSASSAEGSPQGGGQQNQSERPSLEQEKQRLQDGKSKLDGEEKWVNEEWSRLEQQRQSLSQQYGRLRAEKQRLASEADKVSRYRNGGWKNGFICPNGLSYDLCRDPPEHRTARLAWQLGAGWRLKAMNRSLDSSRESFRTREGRYKAAKAQYESDQKRYLSALERVKAHRQQYDAAARRLKSLFAD